MFYYYTYFVDLGFFMRHPFELELSDLENVNSNLEEKSRMRLEKF